MNTFIIEEQFYSIAAVLIKRMVTPDLYDQETAEKRARMLTGAHGPRKLYVGREATPEELQKCRECEEARNSSPIKWTKFS